MIDTLRKDLKIIYDIIDQNEVLLDVGCGEGLLLSCLSEHKKVDCRGIEINQKGVNKCVEKGLAVIQGDANIDLKDYPDNFFTTAVLSQTIQAMISPDHVINNLVRISKRAIISFPNFGYWKIRKDLMVSGKMPQSKILPYNWYDSPNIHLCTIRDFEIFCYDNKIKIQKKVLMNSKSEVFLPFLFGNFFAYQAIFSITKDTR